MRYLSWLIFIATSISGMEEQKKEFYEALIFEDHEKALRMLDQNKTLANADFSVYNKSRGDESGNNDTPLLASICNNDYFCPTLFYSLLDAGADIDKRANRTTQTPLIKALFLENPDIALALLARNADTHKSVPIFRNQSVDALDLAFAMELLEVTATIIELRNNKQPSRLIFDATKQLAGAQIK